MSLDITYSTDTDELTFDLSSFDVDIITKLFEMDEYRRPVNEVFGVGELTCKEHIAVGVLLDSVEELLKVFREKTDILPYTFLFEREVDSNIGKLKSRCGMIGGIRIKGDLYAAEGGLDKCNLIPVTIGEDGKGEDGEPIDIRDRKSIQTDDRGEIKIKKRKKTCVVGNLKKLKAFLEGKAENVIVEKISYF